MAAYGLDDCVEHIFDGTHYARWKNHMLDHFRALGPKFWWIIVVGFSHDLDGCGNRTQAQKDCRTLDAQAKFYLIKALNDEIFDKVRGLSSAHSM
jgi:hypothetical protein